MANGLLIKYDYCTGCHSCEIACRNVLNLPNGQFGIRLLQDGPRMDLNDKWEYTYIPYPTHLCDMCADRVDAGRLPSCVHHCQSGCMEFGPIEELSKMQDECVNSVVFHVYE